MPTFQGISYDQRPFPAPPLTALILGSAIDGPVGQSCWFQNIDEAAFAYGGPTEARVSPSLVANSLTLSDVFQPDNTQLDASGTSKIYQFDSSGNAYSYFFGQLQSSGTPVTLSFDPIGNDPSVAVNPGGIFIETDGYGKGSTGDIIIPLISCIQELNRQQDGNVDDPTFSVAGVRVGESWLPPLPASATVPLQGFSIGIECLGQGDNSTYERYASIQVILGTGSVVIDPGLTGLPYARTTYLFSNYASWNALLDQITFDSDNGVIPIRIISRPARNNPFLLVTPTSGTSGTTSPSYSGGSAAPNLSLASAWVHILTNEDLPIEQASFIVLSGLSGIALAEDPASAFTIMELLIGAQALSEEAQFPILVLPWSLSPPPSTAPYDSTSDLALMETLSTYLGDYADHLLTLWGTIIQDGMPNNLDTTPRAIPVAYATVGALLRDASVVATSINVETDNLMHPQIRTALQTGIPPVLILDSSDPPVATVPTSIPDPTTIQSLSAAGISPVVRSLGDSFKIFAPILLADGSPLHVMLVEESVRYLIQQELDPYIGQNNTQAIQAAIQTDLTSLAKSIPATQTPVGQQIASMTLNLNDTQAQQSGPLVNLLVTGQVSLYGEVGQITFQVEVG